MIPNLAPISANSVPFGLIALGLVLLAWSRHRRWFLHALCAGSLIVVASWLNPVDLLALAIFIVPPYFVIRFTWGKAGSSTFAVTALTVTAQVLAFVYLRKYDWAGSGIWLDHPIAIIGLSYILFRVIHLTVDAPYLADTQLTPSRYGTYVLAFWTILSGPIQRYEDFCAGLKTIGRPENKAVLGACHRAVNGLFKAFLIAPVFLKASDLSSLASPGADWVDFLIVLYAYPVYLYLNFSGYTDLVIAIARLCGFTTLPENFNRPYLARNVLDFWTRWHMSFGTWIRHYVFTPLSKHLLSSAPAPLHVPLLAVSVVVTFIVVGAWHGTTLNFLMFGLFHGTAAIAVSVYGSVLKSTMGRKRSKAFLANPFVHGLSIIISFHFVCATILFFPNSATELHTTLGVFFSAGGSL